MLNSYLGRNRDLTLPNLDRMVPLPPAPLPPWDGEIETLVHKLGPDGVPAPEIDKRFEY